MCGGPGPRAGSVRRPRGPGAGPAWGWAGLGLPPAPLTRAQINAIAESLARFGIGRGARVAIVLSNGPAMASAFLGVATAASAAPLNPAYRAEEFDFYLSDLNAAAVIADAANPGPVAEAARARNIPLIGLSEGEGAGLIDLVATTPARSVEAVAPRPDDDGLVAPLSSVPAGLAFSPIRRQGFRQGRGEEGGGGG